MADRAVRIADALAALGYRDWQVDALPADASRRRYLRLTDGNHTRIVMDSPPGAAEDLDAFLRIGAHLRGLGLAAPEVLAVDRTLGLLVLEDLGPTPAARHLDAEPEDEEEIYRTAVAALAGLQSAPPPSGLPCLDPATGVTMLAPFFDHVLPSAGIDRTAMETELRRTLETHAPVAPILSLRDFHAENLIWRPGREGLDRLGLLDFQDAFLAPPAYDIASLLDDVRRDVRPGTEAAVLRDFAALTGVDPGALTRARAVLSVQRNLRILGIFAALINGQGKTRYRAFLPRLRRHLDRQLADPALARLHPLVAPVLALEETWN